MFNLQRWQGSQHRIGITGGIACGKSAVSKYLKEKKQLVILDADLYAREALSDGTIANHTVRERYGMEILKESNNNQIIDRKKLSKIIFTNKLEKDWLEKLIHPIVKKKFEQELQKNREIPIVGLSIPLLFEAKMTNLCSSIWVIKCKEEIQVKRLINRDKIEKSLAKKLIEAQWPIKKKENLSDQIIENNSSFNDLYHQIDQLFDTLRLQLL